MVHADATRWVGTAWDALRRRAGQPGGALFRAALANKVVLIIEKFGAARPKRLLFIDEFTTPDPFSTDGRKCCYLSFFTSRLHQHTHTHHTHTHTHTHRSSFLAWSLPTCNDRRDNVTNKKQQTSISDVKEESDHSLLVFNFTSAGGRKEGGR